MTTSALNIAVLMGGASAEAEVSRNSAAQVAEALEKKGYRVTRVELDGNCTTTLLALAPDVVFPALDGPPGEDGTVQGYLEILGYAYVGSGVRGSAMAMDKAVAKQIFTAHQLPVLDDLVIPADALKGDSEQLQKWVTHIHSQLGRQVVIKPLNQGSAIGVTPLPNGGDLLQPLTDGLQYGACLVEPYLLGREITVGVLETDAGLAVHPVIEITTGSDQWYDFENRYTQGQSEHIVPAVLDQATSEKLQQIALTAHTALGLRGLSRADFIVTDGGEIALLEVNTLPGMTPTSLYPDGAAHLGYDFAELMDHLVQRAWQRSQA